MTHFYVYDTPGVTPLEGSDLPYAGEFVNAVADLTAPDGSTVTVPVDLDGDESTATLPLLDQEGVYRLQVSVSGPGVSLALPPVRIPVESAGSGWHTLDTARAAWDQAPSDDATLYDALTGARAQVLAYAPALAEDAPVPVNYRSAQVVQARAGWNGMTKNTGSDSYGTEGFSVPTFPLDWHVKQMLRPRRGKPVVG